MNKTAAILFKSMPPHPQDEFYMQQALALAAATTALASPNPQVGCVLVYNGEVIGEGAHLYEHRDHAEIVALKDAAARSHSIAGATAYVTLEPCSHHGRTGPCADALITAKVARVVVATHDPNPQVSGRGIAKLRAAGIDVTIGICEQPARDLIEAFAHFIRHRTPFVTLKAALSVDGKLAPPPAHRFPNQPFWLTGPAAREEVQQLRHDADAILTGIGTVLADDPALTDRTKLPRRRPLLRVILDTHLRMPLNSQLVRGVESDLLILCGTTASTTRIAALEAAGVEVETIPDHAGHLSLRVALATLAERNILSLLLECGSHLNGAFLAQHLVDKAILFYAETELGNSAIPFAQGIPSPFLFEQSLRRITRTSFGPLERQDACVTGYLRDPWAIR
ncbi:bifunctional diaminohydroxyphosphoribosylaminopyrimidine deaminase/5-amino-6-(5-phosphoribosylamino)uracil reductase RibD [Granulicella arctica]|uniref:Riboflavin biosynthesis protein RibD n=1 Tax=Granulicella arctica TaxID=940613 RepID=A0A7Y9PJW7_9BACT|nr:bifunctional diaminohydroxyphosphoribosylaminopyrimidine deaminase/5-amino-6-(5-phosphoribosylamino)uracil reductase RibD [Granulicella arctica]NYF81259.1 diaminohydroxyphosphoribosylaminopyrimidine deaminase/5-amino-6-(5-phosphoribosylamino)uracil reductase [Granulicella arctica]